MRPEAIKDFYIVNGELMTTGDSTIFEKIIRPPIYEVIRIIDGVPLFLEEHLDRMFESANLVGFQIHREEKEIRQDIKELILRNNADKINVKLLTTEIQNKGKIFLVYLLKSFYPPEEYYKNGIHTILFHYERDNPNAKVLFSSFKDEVSKAIKDKNAFEALLVSKSGKIPEGSRSNMFFVKGDKIYTAKAADVLLGITRKSIFNICNKLNIKIIEESIHIDDLEKLDGGFMTGTSVNVLPITSIDDIKLDSVNNKLIEAINNEYINGMNRYIENNGDQWR